MAKVYFFPDITYDEIKPDIIKLYVDLVSLYMELQTAYQDLNQTLYELAEYKDNIDLYVPATHKLQYLQSKIPSLIDRELEIFNKDQSLIPFLEEHIKREFGLKKQLNFENFSFFDVYINPDYEVIKDNFIIMRLIRAIKYYQDYQGEYYRLLKEHIPEIDKESIRDCILYDYSDTEAINTLYVIGTLAEESGDYRAEAKYKSLISFVNPNIERFFINTSFDGSHEFITEQYLEADAKTIKNKILNTIVAIQRNKIINNDDKKTNIVINSRLTFKQIIDTLIHYDYDSSPYDTFTEIIKMEYLKNREEIDLLFAYIQQAYLNIDDQSIDDLDHLFSVMAKKENNTTIGTTRLHQKLLDLLVNKDDIIKKRKDTCRKRQEIELSNSNGFSKDGLN